MLMLLLGLRGGLELRGGCWEVAVAHIGVLLLPKEIQRLCSSSSVHSTQSGRPRGDEMVHWGASLVIYCPLLLHVSVRF